MDYSKQVPAAERTLNILEALSAEPEGLTAGELLEQLDLSRSALFALLNTLKARHYIEQADSRGRYQLGPALWALAPGRQDGLGPLVRAFLEDQAVRQPPETTALFWLDGDEAVMLAQREGQHRVRAVFQPGERRAAMETAAGLALLAGVEERLAIGDWGRADSAGETGDSRPETGDSRVEIGDRGREDGAALLAGIRQDGFARWEGAETVDVACPICADGVQPVAALQVSIPTFRRDGATEEAGLYEARRTAARLSFKLGAPVYQPYGWSAGQPLGPVQPLGDAEVEQFLQGPWSARLACVRADGTPHVLPLWYEWDGQFFWLAASPGAQWKQVVRESERVSLTIDEPWPPLRRAFVEGCAEVVPTSEVPGGLQGLRQRLAVRYLGRGAGQRAELKQTEDWDAVRITPRRVSGQKGLGRA